ncbi:hypothetical protein PRK78_007240 [Emydomyces testavorans]|uniref:Calcineurin-like phosphoesterase domain-containing protein n=1 Tax=Emydomyces testavorans TaxID=2070801 RepID=A0AAF0DR36_9EURO|nr:hypothetical protein PRK78_007240 [Emydomyces testavorans]
MTELQILSDLHLESPSAYDIFDIPVKAPHLALLGDIGNVRDAGFFPFIEAQLHKFRTVFLLLGNHEPYHSSWADATSKIDDFERVVRQRVGNESSSGLGQFVFLDRTRYDVSDDVTILGCTLHSYIRPESAERVSFGLNDFYQIDDWTVEKHNTAHNTDLAWLNEQVATISSSEPGKKIVIFTHHSPVTRASPAVDPAHAGSAISDGFATDLSVEECWKNAKVSLWAFGHTHYNCDFNESGKRVVSNQRGYYFKQAGHFDVEKVVSV